MQQLRDTVLRGSGTEVIIGPGRPTVIIGNRIEAASRPDLAAALRAGDLTLVREDAQSQIRDGADVIRISLGSVGIDEIRLLPLAVKAVAEVVSVPLCIDTSDPDALAAALDVCPGKPLIDAITGEDEPLKRLLPIAIQRRAAVLGKAVDERGPLADGNQRFEIARQLLRMCIVAGMPRDDVILDPLALPLKDDPKAVRITLTIIPHLAEFDQVNLAVRGGAVSRGLPCPRETEDLFLAMSIAAGVGCILADPFVSSRAIKTGDQLLCRLPTLA